MADSEKVKCRDCGFLAVRHWETRQLAEVESGMRATGDSPTLVAAKRNLYERTPICFVRAFPLQQEAKAEDDKAAFLRVINEDRPCEQFIRWEQGFTPKEHKEMLAEKEEREWRAEQERKDREYRDRKDRDDREYRDRRDRDDADWRARQERESRRQSNRQLWIAGVAAALIVAFILAATQLYSTKLLIDDAKAGRAPPAAQPVSPPAKD